MAKGQRRQDNNSRPRKDMQGTIDRQMIVPEGYENFTYPVVMANPRRRVLNPDEIPSHEQKTGPANPFGGSRRQSRY
jgi:hypothetical protein